MQARSQIQHWRSTATQTNRRDRQTDRQTDRAKCAPPKSHDIAIQIQMIDQTLIVAFDSDKGCNVDLDIALAHPWSSDIFQGHLSQMVLLQKEEKRGRRQNMQRKIYQVDQQSVSFP